ncbi:PREDICTED: uncharacterized protein LOC106816886 [Priapulus caudatus]|uniref:Uncharacterized protein LOC106816886 n=1 Tax=Priapulus caudatus TaxID=37621 RepID=A0ABM1EXU2_PRICU|nr:PREDICTED: uncharacterized protein LOC106816886 [Priapulus caudatus]
MGNCGSLLVHHGDEAYTNAQTGLSAPDLAGFASRHSRRLSTDLENPLGFFHNGVMDYPPYEEPPPPYTPYKPPDAPPPPYATYDPHPASAATHHVIARASMVEVGGGGGGYPATALSHSLSSSESLFNSYRLYPRRRPKHERQRPLLSRRFPQLSERSVVRRLLPPGGQPPSHNSRPTSPQRR